MLVLMVAAAAAGGISATFHTPIAGTFFALEVVLRRFNVRNFTIVVVSAVVANLVATAYRGEVADLGLPPFDTAGGWRWGCTRWSGWRRRLSGIIFVRTRFFHGGCIRFRRRAAHHAPRCWACSASGCWR